MAPSIETIAACDDHVLRTDEGDLMQPYSCEACGQNFPWAGALFKHMQIHHKMQVPNDTVDTMLYFLAEQNEEVNSKLRETMDTIGALQAQFCEFLKIMTPIKCTICSYTAPNTGALNNHMGAKHKEKTAPPPRNKANLASVPPVQQIRAVPPPLQQAAPLPLPRQSADPQPRGQTAIHSQQQSATLQQQPAPAQFQQMQAPAQFQQHQFQQPQQQAHAQFQRQAPAQFQRQAPVQFQRQAPVQLQRQAPAPPQHQAPAQAAPPRLQQGRTAPSQRPARCKGKLQHLHVRGVYFWWGPLLFLTT